MQAGFVGAWGEWHGSTSGLETKTAMRAIVDGLLDALPSSRCIQIRTPAYKLIIVGSDAHLTEREAFSGAIQARIGHHNDCFLADKTDVGTYDPRGLPWQKTYLANDTQFVPMGGETCLPSEYTEFHNARAELERMHWTYLNRGFHGRVIEDWKSNGLYPEADKHLGYRLALVSSDCEATVATGGRWQVQVTVKNVGWAAPINPREVILVLKPRGSLGVYQVTLPVDLRRWLPGNNIVTSYEIGIPSDLPNGEYSVYLKFVDPHEHLRNRVEYMIRLANQGLWESTSGLHDLRQTVIVSHDTHAPPYKGNTWLKPALQSASRR